MSVEQLSLDDLPSLPAPVARRTDPPTSWMAARLAEPRSGTNRALALALLRERGPQTDFELATASGLQQTTIGKRRGELVAAGFVRATDLRRRSPSGAWAIVWEAIPPAESQAAT
jgi:hypothetical protein